MKNIKSWRVFESGWSTEEFRDEVRKALGERGLRPVEIRELVKRLDLRAVIETGVEPHFYILDLVKQLGLERGGGHLGFNMPKRTQSGLDLL